jgi:hypothetical protein
MRANRGLRLAGAVLALAVAPLATARAETVRCTFIDALPLTITVPGVYCLRNDLSYSGTGEAIRIEADDVTIDLNQHTLNFERERGAVGIRALNRNRLTILDGRIRHFGSGVVIQSSAPTFASTGGHRIENVEVDDSVIYGLVVQGSGNLIRGNRVVATGFRIDTPQPTAILTRGPSVRILDNDVVGVSGWGGRGIRIGEGPGGLIEGNRVTDVGGTNPNSVAVAIEVQGGRAVTVAGNRISTQAGETNSIGIRMEDGSELAVRDNIVNLYYLGIDFEPAASGIYMGNLVSGAVIPYSGGTPAGSTNY